MKTSALPADGTAEADTTPPPPWPGHHRQDDTLTFLASLSAAAHRPTEPWKSISVRSTWLNWTISLDSSSFTLISISIILFRVKCAHIIEQPLVQWILAPLASMDLAELATKCLCCPYKLNLSGIFILHGWCYTGVVARRLPSLNSYRYSATIFLSRNTSYIRAVDPADVSIISSSQV